MIHKNLICIKKPSLNELGSTNQKEKINLLGWRNTRQTKLF